ncbi:MAG: hypothetical protein HYT07_03545 [Candidatus Levybacteria bacterium]|nr:hypothetical protein [Candidatus Levybacteria bacterium]
MIYLLLLFLEIALLFFLSRAVSQALSRFLSIQILSFIFLPGVIIHELSHMLVASVLFVRVGDMEFSPKITEGKLKLGSVAIAKTDPVRRAIIGFAPVFTGVLIILGIIYFFSNSFLLFQENQIYMTVFMVLAIIYILFAISNTMFSSRSDMEGTLELIIVFLVIFAVLYFLGFRVPVSFLEYLNTPGIVKLFKEACLFLSAPIAIDFVILRGIKLFRKEL